MPNAIEVGKVVEAGLGGTANALLWLLQFGPALRGEWVGYEHEDLEPTNIRYLLKSDCDRGSKAELIRRKFVGVHPELEFHVVPDRFEAAAPGLIDRTLGLATVDDPAIRVEMQRRGIPVVLNVGTSNKFVTASRHEVSKIRDGAACLECFFGSVHQVVRREREATVSFVVALISAVLAAEFYKSYCFPGSVLADTWAGCVFYPQGRQTNCLPADLRMSDVRAFAGLGRLAIERRVSNRPT